MARKLLIPAAALLMLAGAAVQAQNRSIAVPSRDPSGRTTFGQGPAAPTQFGPGFANTGPFAGAQGFAPQGFAPQAASGPQTFAPQPFGGGSVFIPGVGFMPSSTAAAQGFIPPTGVNTVPSGVDAFGNPIGASGFGTGSGFVNQFGQPMDAFGNPVGVPGGVPVDAFGNPIGASGFGTGASFTASPLVTPGFGTGYGVPFYGGYPGYGQANPNLGLAYSGMNPGADQMTGAIAATRSRGMVTGVNAPPVNPNAFVGRNVRIDTTPKTPEDFDRARRIRVTASVAGTREEFRNDADRSERAVGTRIDAEINGSGGRAGSTGTGTNAAPAGISNTGTIQTAPATRDQVILASKAQHLMASRPMREGLVTKIDTDTIEVNYTCNSMTQTKAFPAGEVFFFRAGGELATAAVAKGTLKIGDQVMVACNDEPRQAVAGMRQEMRSNGTDSSSAAQTQTGTTRARSPRKGINSLGK